MSDSGNEDIQKRVSALEEFHESAKKSIQARQKGTHKSEESSKEQTATPNTGDQAPLGMEIAGITYQVQTAHISSFPNEINETKEIEVKIHNVEMPFSLLNNEGMIRPPTHVEIPQIMALIPGAWSVKIFPPYLIIVTEELSNLMNLPTSIAGVTCYYTDKDYDLGPLAGCVCFGRHLFWEDNLTGVMAEAKDMLEKYLAFLWPMKVRALGWGGSRWIMFYEGLSKVEATQLPSTLGAVVATAAPLSMLKTAEFKRLSYIWSQEDRDVFSMVGAI